MPAFDLSRAHHCGTAARGLQLYSRIVLYLLAMQRNRHNTPFRKLAIDIAGEYTVVLKRA
jgi:hypothetical protein